MADKSKKDVVESFGLIASNTSRVLVLGTVPSPKSRELQLNYGNPRNRFWPVLGRLSGREVPAEPACKLEFALELGLALWDVLASCEISGAADSSIAQPVPNNIAWALTQAPIHSIFCTGTKAAALYGKLVEPELQIPCIALPSTSPANARASLDELAVAYEPLLAAAARADEPLALRYPNQVAHACAALSAGKPQIAGEPHSAHEPHSSCTPHPSR